MARQPDGATPRSEYVRFRVTKQGKDMITALRAIKGESESGYFRRLVEEDYAKNRSRIK